MDAFLQMQIPINQFLQSLGAWLAPIMKALSYLGNEQFFMLMMPLLYWCYDSSIGIRVGVMMLLSSGTGHFLKLAFHSPRPYWVDPNVHAYASETSFGLPSTHSQMAAAVWGTLAHLLKKPWATWAAVALIVLIGLSRVYLGVHFAIDILAGWLFGGILLWLFIRLDHPLTHWINQRSLAEQILLAFASALGLVLISSIFDWMLSGFTLLGMWQANATLVQPGVVLNPLDASGIYTVAGTWFGFLTGVAWFQHLYGPFNPTGSAGKRVLRFLLGIIVLFAILYGLDLVFPSGANLLSYALRFLRYGLIGLWVSLGAPWIFIKLKLVTLQKPKKGLHHH